MMAISVFELFSIGVGPSSSHTVGPMRAAKAFVEQLNQQSLLLRVGRLVCDLYGSLALTGKGHSTDVALLLGLSGFSPEEVNPDKVPALLQQIRQERRLKLYSSHSISFVEESDLLFHKDRQLPYHPNGMRFSAYDAEGRLLLEKVFYSVGGGFIVDHASAERNATLSHAHEHVASPLYPFETAEAMLGHCERQNVAVAELMRCNERCWHDDEAIDGRLLKIWAVMKSCIERGCQQEGELPGGLKVQRRAHRLYLTLSEREKKGKQTPTDAFEWVSLWALAVNEENAAGSRVVTAPTNGSAGVIPAVINYYLHFCEGASEKGVIDFLLVAGAIGILYKAGASISAAEMGCMGEVGVACSMAAAGLTAALGGSNLQIENAAEIGMEHNLGLTCDPIMGLVQVPCIERNTMGAVQAINASLLAMHGDGKHRVSLDQVIATMRQTGHDMGTIYKETSLGGLAVNVPEC